jgi:PRTRC genetic system ThiF family protein
MDRRFSLARPVGMAQTTAIRLILVGAGGNGAWLVPHLVRIACLLRDRGRTVSLWIVDPDTVEPKNIPRQNFVLAEVGMNKAMALVHRYAGRYAGTDIIALPERFDPELVRQRMAYDTQTILIGCVDNAQARQALARALDSYQGDGPKIWWLDLGNDEYSGRVLLGCTHDTDDLRCAFAQPHHCRWLPAPDLQYPDLLQPRPEELAQTPLSCAEIQLRNTQSLGINALLAAHAAQYLLELLVTQNLRRFATTIDALAGVATSRYTTPDEIATAIGQPDLFRRKRAR